MLGARIVVEQSSLVNETHVLTPQSSFVCSSRLVKKIVGSRTSIQDQVGVAEKFWDHFGVAKRKGLGTAALEGGLIFAEWLDFSYALQTLSNHDFF